MFQSIYGDKGYYTHWTSRDQKLFSRKVDLSQESVVAIISECIEWGIFNKEKYEKFNILTSRRIQDHYATSTYKRVGVDMKKEYFMIDISEKKHINNVVSDDGNEPTIIVSDVKSTQSKVQYSKKENKEPIPPKWSEESDEYRLSLYLYNHMLLNNDRAKKPNFQSWSDSIDKMIRIDNRSVEDIKKVIKFCQNDSFWKSNILSTSKLRDKYDQLFLKMKEQNKPKEYKNPKDKPLIGAVEGSKAGKRVELELICD
jgi:hypothetical protein